MPVVLLARTTGTGAYCKMCMFYCATGEIMEEHILSCTAGNRQTVTQEVTSRQSDAVIQDSQPEISESLSSGDSNNEGREVRTAEHHSRRDDDGHLTDYTKPFKCSRCGRAYQLNQSLQRHRWKCDRSRPIPCALCGMVYYRADGLQHHMRAVHNVDCRISAQRKHPGLESGQYF